MYQPMGCGGVEGMWRLSWPHVEIAYTKWLGVTRLMMPQLYWPVQHTLGLSSCEDTTLPELLHRPILQ